ncbi:MAG: thymidine phosphorylase [Thermomicrobia bacterium]|nr:thymidine phosphorylase [Thermomicrobia bacterium]
MAAFSMVRVIERTRRGELLGAETVKALVDGFTRGAIPDYQTAAWLMAVLWRGLAPDDLTALTMAMARSGDMLDLSSIGRPVADKHSTGGVGDKTTLVVAPIVAACGVPVAKMSGRGLGHTGGTVDKLESIPGFNPALTVAQFMAVLRTCDLVIAGQSADLAPADGKLYALRDVTGTVPSIPLIASSIMAKKLAIGADAILLDVKVGRGAFMETMADATALAETMVGIGTGAGKQTVAVISDMDRPLGRAVGNALEVIEAVEALRGGGPNDLRALALHEAALLLVMTGVAADEAAGAQMAAAAIASGAAFEKFAAVVAAQGGDRRAVEDLSRLPQSPVIQTVTAPESGYIAAIEPLAIGRAAMRLGAGRERKGDTIDPAVGIVLARTVGESVTRGDPLFQIHARDAAQASSVQANALAAFRFSPTPVVVPPLVKKTITIPF